MYNGSRVVLDPKTAEYFKNPHSPGYKAFMEGARAMSKALRNMTPEEFAKAVANAGNSHIAAVLIEAERKDTELRRSDIRAHFDAYEWDIREALAFLFDLPLIDLDSGCATDRNGNFLEDEAFRPFAEERTVGWADCMFVVHGDDGRQITRKEYLELDDTMRNECTKTMFFTLRFYGHEIMKNASYDACFVEELIKRVIDENDSASVTRRLFLYAVDERYQHEYGDISWCPLDDHRDLVLKCLYEKDQCSPSVMAGKLSGSFHAMRTKGQCLIDQVRQKPNSILSLPELTYELKGVLDACLTNDPLKLALYITDVDFINYTGMDGRHLVDGADGRFEISLTDENCKRIFMGASVPCLCSSVATILNDAAATSDGVVSTNLKLKIKPWANLLVKYGYITSLDAGIVFSDV